MRRTSLLIIAAGYLLIIVVMTVLGLTVAGRGPDPSLRTLVLITSAVVAILAAGLAVVIAQLTTRPFREMKTAFRRATEGDFTVRIKQPRRSSAGEIAGGFNEMVFKTGTMVEELRRQREALDAILSSMRDGLLVLDDAGRVVRANETLCRIAGQAEPRGKFYWEVIREPGFVELIRSAEAGSSAGAEIELDGRIYSLGATALAASKQTVVTFHDITEITRAAELKKNLVTSVSHELRTPLTAIKGFVETVIENPGDDSRKYLDIVLRHTDRLVSMVNDLLALSELEERQHRLELESVDLAELSANVMKLFERAAAAKGLKLELATEPGLPKALGDPVRLEQVLLNLVDNAVKYTEQGGITLSLSARTPESQNPRAIVLSVSDTGIGIAPEHLPRLFSRFYVVDKSRSRRLGGTGLGLAIVKHIVLLHGGTVTVDSTPGLGTKVTVTLTAC